MFWDFGRRRMEASQTRGNSPDFGKNPVHDGPECWTFLVRDVGDSIWPRCGAVAFQTEDIHDFSLRRRFFRQQKRWCRRSFHFWERCESAITFLFQNASGVLFKLFLFLTVVDNRFTFTEGSRNEEEKRVNHSSLLAQQGVWTHYGGTTLSFQH